MTVHGMDMNIPNYLIEMKFGMASLNNRNHLILVTPKLDRVVEVTYNFSLKYFLGAQILILTSYKG